MDGISTALSSDVGGLSFFKLPHLFPTLGGSMSSLLEPSEEVFHLVANFFCPDPKLPLSSTLSLCARNI